MIKLILLTTLMVIGKTSVASDSNCTYPPLCADRKHYSRAVVELDNRSELPREPCSCEGRCHLHGTCCPDAPDYNPNTIELELKDEGQGWTCKKLVPEAVDPTDYLAVFMVDWCPPGTDELLEAKCTKDTLSLANFNYTYLLDVPVMSSNSGVIYQNVFCGKCHKEHYFENYHFDLSCDCEITSLEEMQTLDYNEGNLTWTGSIPETVKCLYYNTITCKLHVHYPSDIGHLCEVGLVDTCQESKYGLIPIKIRNGCTYGDVYYVQDSYSRVYKNINCSMCNGVSLLETHCLYPRERPSSLLPKGDFWDLSDLFSVDNTKCDKNYVYDPVFGVCYQLENVVEPGEKPSITNSTEPACDDDVCVATYKGPSPTSIFFLVMMSLSVICLFLHMLIFLIRIKDKNLHSTNLFAMTIALFIAEIVFIFGANLCNSYIDCYVLTIVVYYCFLVSFFWMNVISFDICKTFRSRHIRLESNRKFLRYFFYAWGFPVLITLCAIMVDLLAPSSKVAPGFAIRGFWFSNAGGLIMFFIIPVEIIFIANLVMFILSAIAISKQRKAGKFATKSVKKNRSRAQSNASSQSQGNRITREEEMKIHQLLTGKVKKTYEQHEDEIKKLKLYCSLAILMGIPWIFAVFVDVHVAFEYLFNIFNSLQGVFIFFAFDFNQKTLRGVISACTGEDTFSSYYSSTGSRRSSSSSASSKSGRHKKKKARSRVDSSISKNTTDTFMSETNSSRDRASLVGKLNENIQMNAAPKSDEWAEFQREINRSKHGRRSYEEKRTTALTSGTEARPTTPVFKSCDDQSITDETFDVPHTSPPIMIRSPHYEKVGNNTINGSKRKREEEHEYNAQRMNRQYSLKRAVNQNDNYEDVVEM